MRAAVERSLPFMLLIALVVLQGLPESPLRTALSWALAGASVVTGLLWLLARVSLPRTFGFGARPSTDAVGRLRAHAASLTAFGFEEGPPRLIELRPGVSMHALPLVNLARSTWALALEDVGQTHPPMLELLTCFGGELRVSSMDTRVAVNAPRPRHALVQVEHGAPAEVLWREHDRLVAELSASGLEPEPVNPGAFEELFERSMRESITITEAAPLTVTALTLLRMLVTPRPEERPLLSQPAARALLVEHGYRADEPPTE